MRSWEEEGGETTLRLTSTGGINAVPTRGHSELKLAFPLKPNQVVGDHTQEVLRRLRTNDHQPHLRRKPLSFNKRYKGL